MFIWWRGIGTLSWRLEARIVKEGREQTAAKISEKFSSDAAIRKDNAKEKVPCEHCEKTFASSSTLKQHITVHTNEKPYQCKECPNKFRNNNRLLGHRKKAHPKILPNKITHINSQSYAAEAGQAGEPKGIQDDANKAA